MTPLPGIQSLLAELAARNPRYATAWNLAQLRLCYEILDRHILRKDAEAISRGKARYASTLTSPQLLHEIENELAAELTSLVANRAPPKAYSLFAELLDEVHHAG